MFIVCVNEPSSGAYYGGVVAKPIGAKVFSRIFETKAIQPTDANELSNKPTIAMPNVVGLTVAEACAKLKIIGLNSIFDGEGEIVLMQLPPENTMLYLGEIVYLITN